MADFRQLPFWRLQLHGQNWQPIYHSRFAQNSKTARKLKPRDCHEDLRKQQMDCKPVILHNPAQALGIAATKPAASRMLRQPQESKLMERRKEFPKISLTIFPFQTEVVCPYSPFQFRKCLGPSKLRQQVPRLGAKLGLNTSNLCLMSRKSYNTLHCKAWRKDLKGIADCLLLLCRHPLCVHLIQRWRSAISLHIHHPYFPRGQTHEPPTLELCLLDNQR